MTRRWPPRPSAARRLQRRASDAPFIAMALSQYLRIARTLAARIVLGRSTPPATPPETQDYLDDASLHEAVSRWGLNATIWLAKLQQLDRRRTGESAHGSVV